MPSSLPSHPLRHDGSTLPSGGPRAQDSASGGPPSGSRQPPTRQLGPYALQHELGRGSYGAVFLARHVPSGKQVALKVLLGARDDEVVKRFKREAAITARLQAPAIVRTLDVGFDGKHHYYTMEFCPGPTLKERVRQGPLPSLEAAAIVAKLAEAMAEAHQWGVIHRDLKPANVILSEPDGEPRITDFGLARDYAQERMTHTGDVMGTPAYMAPEQFRGDRSLDHRVDIYALGVMLYQLLTGVVPYKGSNLPELAAVVEMGQAKPPRAHDPEIPSELEAICLRAMDTDPNKRFVTASALASALAEACKGASARAPRASKRVRRPRSRAEEPPARAVSPLVWSGWAVAAVLLGLLLWQVLSAPAGETEADRVASLQAAERAEQEAQEHAARRELELVLAEVDLLRDEGAPLATLTRQLNRAIKLSKDPQQQDTLSRRIGELTRLEETISLARRLLQEVQSHNAARQEPTKYKRTAEQLEALPRAGFPLSLAEAIVEVLGVFNARIKVFSALDEVLRVEGQFEAGQKASLAYYRTCEQLSERYPEVAREGYEIKLKLLKRWEAFMPDLMLMLRGLTLNRLDRQDEARQAFRKIAQSPSTPRMIQRLLTEPDPLFTREEVLLAQRMMNGQ